jgi:hypothetical protein
MRGWAMAVVAGGMMGSMAAAQGPAVLGSIMPGEWQVREAGPGGEVRRLCVVQPAELLQIRHGPGTCTRTVLTASSRSTTVSYACPSGTGRTTLTLTGVGEAHIQTQGLVGGQPFDTEYDARLIGRCA